MVREIRRKPWGKVHMMRSGKRNAATFQDDDDELWAEEEDVDMANLRRVTRSSQASTILWASPMVRLRKRSEPGWSWHLVRSLGTMSGLSRRGGRNSLFGGGHMMRSGKRSTTWGPTGSKLTGR